jgi:hypothetical protein
MYSTKKNQATLILLGFQSLQDFTAKASLQISSAFEVMVGV